MTARQAQDAAEVIFPSLSVQAAAAEWQQAATEE
jgi:hypothetical protein